MRQTATCQRRCSGILALGLLLIVAGLARADRIELLSGAKVEGEIVARDEQSVTLKATVGSRTFTRKYPIDRIHAIVKGDDREVLNAMEGGTPAGSASKGKARTPAAVQRTRAEIDQWIDQEGRTPPDWWDSTPLEFPKTLDLSFPEPAPGPWNNQKNVGQYLWDVIHPNQGKWRQGVRFMHHLLTVNKDRPDVHRRIMNTLGGMYYRLLQDFPRAAYWWRRAGVDKDDRFWSGVQLAECYWKMGNKPMAMELLRGIELQYSTIKLLADMGQTEEALRIAESAAQGEAADLACVYAGDACRVAGLHRRALQYYERVLKVPAQGQAKGRIERNHTRARANIEGIKLFDLLDLARVPDGAYRSSSMGYEAPVHVEVTVKGGRIDSVRVTDHREKQYYSSITDTCRKIVAVQGVTGIDATSSATITSEAILNATAKALAGATK